MSYCTQSDIEQYLPGRELAEITDDVAGDTTVSLLVTDAIAAADGLIDSFVGKHYLVPLAAPVPALIRDFSRVIAIWKLYGRREVVPSTRQTAYEDVLAQLKAIAEGTRTLGVEPIPPVSSSEKAARGGPDQVFTRDSLDEY